MYVCVCEKLYGRVLNTCTVCIPDRPGVAEDNITILT